MNQNQSNLAGRLRPALLLLLLGLGALAALLFLRPVGPSPVAVVPSAPLEAARTNLVLADGRWRVKEGTNLFTGLLLEHHPDGTLRSRSMVVNGLLHGLSEGWYTNGQAQVSEQFQEGVSHGLRTKWYPDGARQSEAAIVDGKLHGTFRRWHENGTLSEQVEFVGGQPQGVSVSYFPSGCLKARVELKNARPIRQEFWKDGERKG